MRGLDRINPLSIAFYYLCVLGVTMFSMHPLLLGISLLFSVINGVTAAVGRRARLFSLGLFAIVALLNPLLVHNGATVLFYLNDRPVTLEAALYGVAAATMIMAALGHLRVLSRLLTSDKVLYLFGRFSPRAALLLSMSLRYTALLRQRWHKIQDAQRALGLYDDDNLIDAVRGRARVLSTLITWTLENGIITAESMEGRGYGCGRRTSYAPYRVRLYDGLLMMLCAVLTALTVFGSEHGAMVYYPGLMIEWGGAWSFAGAGAFAVLCAIPLILNTKEAVKWRSLRSKI